MSDKARFENVFTLTSGDGTVLEICNEVKDDAINSFLNVFFDSEAATANWFIGLIDNTGFTATATADTAALHTGWSEFVTYDEAVRQTWTPNTSTAKSTSGNVAAFTVGTVAVGQKVQGLFVINESNKAGSTGLMFSTGVFAAPTEILTGELLQVTYTVRLIN